MTPPTTPVRDLTPTADTPARGNGQAVEFLSAIFEPGDLVLIRPIETWKDETGRKKSKVDYQYTQYVPIGLRNGDGDWRAFPEGLARAVARQMKRSESTKANVFFGVCPRAGGDGRFDLAWQIRVVRVLWADLDDCTVDEARSRCEEAFLPEPSTAGRQARCEG